MKTASCCTLLVFFLLWTGVSFSAEKWEGVDEAVINKIAREQGREPQSSFIPIVEGNALLFVFLIAGAVGGFVAGYYWRVLLEGRKKSDRISGE